ncbi:MAG TPA: UDP-glucose--hexose-1-phosphate uridylyltransferase [Treponema sp.]|nr:UDP-glucose--hexose-1-phosphate uridylyltransferase [Treponema sp.]HCA19653.1 UDP-glucose--hexose-1-phosphate uridylyltransferase [Treponema sp.]
MTVYENINALAGYALTTGLIEEDDLIYTQNRLLELFALDGFESAEQARSIPSTRTEDLEQILSGLLDYAAEKNLFPNDGIVNRDLFDTKIMGTLVPRPSEVQKKFMDLYKKSPREATDWYYKFSQDTDYIRRYRVCKDVKWQAKTEYGDIDITINLSKPEKDPRAIAMARNAKQVGYPSCLLCKENVGYAGRLNHAARQNHRIIPLRLNGTEWGLQYSPYVYYNEHCIVFSYEHTPMKISRETFATLFDFIKLFPHYTIGSNADLPIVGGSILTHNHYQGGHYEFAMARAPIETRFTVRGFDDVTCGIVKWPMSVIRLNCPSSERLIELADKILRNWRIYTDEKAFIYSQTNGEDHNTITPIARMHNGNFELDLVLRNNITTEEHPLGVFHPHAELHHIKKENIGLIEVMGLAVLPSRLKKELSDLGNAIIQGRSISDDEVLAKHAEWVKSFMPKYPRITASNVDQILKDEVALVFARVLEDAGVYKRTPEGKEAFLRFIKSFV